jgi:hypothetical protein
MISDKLKSEIIFTIDEWLLFVDGKWLMELKIMRNKYIFKDISKSEYDKDLFFIKSIEASFWNFYNEKFGEQENHY